MKIIGIEYLIQKGSSSNSEEVKMILEEIHKAVSMVVWPDGSDFFTLYPVKKANGGVLSASLHEFPPGGLNLG